MEIEKEFCIYCGKERTVREKTGFYSRHTGTPTYNLVCSNKDCTKKYRLKKLLNRKNSIV